MADPPPLLLTTTGNTLPNRISYPSQQQTRPTHRKRTSLSTLSTDTSHTTATLPEYTTSYKPVLQPVLQAQNISHSLSPPSLPSLPLSTLYDQPPEYPASDSADEADEESDSQEPNTLPTPPPPLSPPPFSPPAGLTRRSSSKTHRRSPLKHYQGVSSPASPSFKQDPALGSLALATRGKDKSRDKDDIRYTHRSVRGHERSDSEDAAIDRIDEDSDDIFRSGVRRYRSHSQFQRRLTRLPSSSDTYLDSLLARSVHALELSNALLQSSMSTQSSLSTVLALGAGASHYTSSDRMLDNQARVLSARIRENEDVHERWREDLDGLAKEVVAFCGDGNKSRDSEDGRDDVETVSGPRRMKTAPVGMRKRTSTAPTGTISQSLPSSSSPGMVSPHRARKYRRPSGSVDFNHSTGRLQLASPEQHRLQSHPPRALTQYINVSAEGGDAFDANAPGGDGVLLPSTLGIRSPPHIADLPGANKASLSSHTSTGSTSNPTSPSSALANFLRQAQASSSSSTNASAYAGDKGGSGASVASFTTSRSSRTSRSPTPTLANSRAYHHSRSRSRSSSNPPGSPSPRPRHLPIPPPIAELPSNSDSSTSENSPQPYRTVESLRKILDDQHMGTLPPQSTDQANETTITSTDIDPKITYRDSTDVSLSSRAERARSRTRILPPRSPPVAPVTSTSTTTTSISRLFTKGAHSTSTRAPSPPKHSSLKRRDRLAPPAISTSISASTTSSAPNSLPPTPAAPSSKTNSITSIADLLSVGTGFGGTSRTSSGRSTPRTVAFGPLPESYAESKPGGAGSSRFREQQKSARARSRSRSRSKSHGLGVRRDGVLGGGHFEKGSSSDGERSWWTTWLTGGSMLSMSAARQEEKTEDRMARAWGRSGLEDWAI